MLRIQVQKLRQAYRESQSKNDIKALLSTIEELRKTSGGEKVTREPAEKSKLGREDLKLICFDVLTAG